MTTKAKSRFKVAWKAFSVQALTFIASVPLILPHVEPYIKGGVDPKHVGMLTSLVAIGGILGWIKPQPKLDKELKDA